MFGLHFSDALAGRVFTQTAMVAGSPPTLGAAIPIFSATAIAGALPLWNPPGSNRVVELISVDIVYTSGTSTYGPIGIMAGQLSAIGTATGCSAFAATVPQNAYILGGASSKCVSSAYGTVTVTAGVATPPVLGVVGAGWYRSLAAVNLEAATGTAHGTTIATYGFNGTVIVPQGMLIYLAALVATSALFASSIVWKEIPINPSLG